MEYDIFISYRRDGGSNYARTFKSELEKRGFRVFLDYDDILDGVFDQRIIDAINQTTVFLLILSKGVFDRCVNEDDWVRQEILHASKCGCQIVPVNIDDSFEGLPSTLSEDLFNIIHPIQFSEIQTKTLFSESINKLVNDRIAKHVRKEEHSGIETHIETDADCTLFRFQTMVKQLKAGEDNIVFLPLGKYKLDFVSVEFPEIRQSQVHTLTPGTEFDFIEVSIKEKIEEELNRRKLEKEARERAEREEQRKAEEKKKLEAAEEGDRIAQYEMGEIYRYRKDYQEAIKWHQKAASQGYGPSIEAIGDFYYYGTGVKKDRIESCKWYEKAALRGCKNSKSKMDSVRTYHSRARSFYDRKQYVEAYNNYKMAADEGLLNAISSVGVCKLLGIGTNKDEQEAIRWFQMAADHESDYGQYNLGYCYQNGLGVSKNIQEAKYWYQKSADKGYREAKEKLAELTMTPEDMYQKAKNSRDEHDAFKWYQMAAEKGHGEAQCRLAYCYMNGIGTIKNTSEAKKWYNKAAEQGVMEAKWAMLTL